MPIPIILGGVAIAAGAAGAGSGIKGGVKMKGANDTMKDARSKMDHAMTMFKACNDETLAIMDDLGKQELTVLQSFEHFSDIIEKIQGRPDFRSYRKDDIDLPEYAAEELKKISIGAGLLLGGLGGAAVGTAGGFAAAGATTSAVMAFGTASTGTAISALSGAAATNATLAALGGGSIAMGGLGMTAGSILLGTATAGIALLVGGIIFNVTGSKLSEKADDAYDQAERSMDEVEAIVEYLDELAAAAVKFKEMFSAVEGQYRERLAILEYIVNFSEKTMWSDFTEKEKKLTENTVLLVGLLYRMCKVNLVIKNEEEDGLNTVNHSDIDMAVENADSILEELGDVA